MFASAPATPINPSGIPIEPKKIFSTLFASFRASALVAVFRMWKTLEKEHWRARLCKSFRAVEAAAVDAAGGDILLDLLVLLYEPWSVVGN